MNFFIQKPRQNFFAPAHLFYAKLDCLLSLSGWYKESTIHHLWWEAKSSLEHVCAVTDISRLHQLTLIYSHQSTIWVTITRTLLCNISGKNGLYSLVRNFDTVFIYQQILNFTRCETSVMFEGCKHSTSRFISWGVAQSTISFIIVSVFHFLRNLLPAIVISIFIIDLKWK